MLALCQPFYKHSDCSKRIFVQSSLLPWEIKNEALMHCAASRRPSCCLVPTVHGLRVGAPAQEVVGDALVPRDDGQVQGGVALAVGRLQQGWLRSEQEFRAERVLAQRQAA